MAEVSFDLINNFDEWFILRHLVEILKQIFFNVT